MNTDELNRNVSDFEALHDINLDGADALVAALQESAAHIRDLRERIAALEECQLARRIDALESNAQNTHVAQNGSDEKHEAAPIAEGHAVLAVGEPILELEGELKDDMWTYLLAAGLNELAVRVVIYAEEGEGQS